MIFWIDAQLNPKIALAIRNHYSDEAYSVKELGLRDATDWEIFSRAHEENAVVNTKDSDFIQLVH